MRTTCRDCRTDLLIINPLTHNVSICPQCDTIGMGTSMGIGMRVGPPNTPGSRNGWITSPTGDQP